MATAIAPIRQSEIALAPWARAASLSTVNDETRTVELVFSTGVGVRRYDYYNGTAFIEKLSLNPRHVRLDRLNSGAPILDTHSGWSITHQYGVVEDKSASVDGKRGTAVARFSRRADVEPVWMDIKDRIIRNVSVGYAVFKYEEETAKPGQLPVRTAVDWEPYEISLVPMPADVGAQMRSGKQQGVLIEPHVAVIVARGCTDQDLNLRYRYARLARQ